MTDVVIIGAGAAGLAAAEKCRTRGLSFMMIEARNRIGGRVITEHSLGAPVDGGATFIHFADKNPWSGIATRLGIQTVKGGWRRGDFRAFDDGKPVSEVLEAARWAARNRMWALAEDIEERHDLSFSALVEKAPDEVRRAAYRMTRGAVGEEPDRVSVADYIQLYEGGDHVVPGGYGTLVHAFGQHLPVQLETVATAVDWSGAGVRVETNRGTLQAGSAIITVPLGVLKAGAIRFTPTLPQDVQSAFDGLAMGALTKMALKFEGTRFNATPDMQYIEVGDSAPGMTFELWPFGQDIVVAWFGADYAREVNRMGPLAVEHILARFLKIVGPEGRKAFRGASHFAWTEDPFSLGSYSYARPGHRQARDLLRKPVGERLWFAGEAMAGRASMTVAGAFNTGEHAAEAVFMRMKSKR